MPRRKKEEIKQYKAMQLQNQKQQQRRKKVDPFKTRGIRYIDYKDAKILTRYVNEQGKILPARITGVGFFDRSHGATGAAPNVFEIHPVLKIEWL